jgi:hypothetical protein
MRKLIILGASVLGLLVTLTVAGVAVAGGAFDTVKPSTYDPMKTYLVGTSWTTGIGCPTNSKVTYDGTSVGHFTDAACTTGAQDSKNAGLLLAKTGPTGNYAGAQATLSHVPETITELGYDLRKPGTDQTDSRGSHCGAGAPRFNLIDSAGATYFVGCNSPAPAVTASSNGWQRLRWTPVMAYPAAGGSPVDVSTLTIKRLQLVFDEGQDTGPDNFGLAVLDNIDVNGTLVGK